MHKINIETSQNITLSFPTASVVERIGAYLIDFCIQILYFFTITAIFDGLLDGMFPSYEQKIKYESLIYVFYLPILFYHLLFEYFNNGQSIGKKILKLKVVSVEGTRPDLGAFFTRWLVGLLEFFLFSGAPAMLFIMFGKKAQRIGDVAANTAVIKLKDARLLKSASDQFNFDTSYEPVFGKAMLLNDAQIELINRVLFQDNPLIRNRQIVQLADKIEQEYNIKRKETPQRDYLKQIVKDYAFMNWLEENKGQVERLKYNENRFEYGKTTTA